MSFYKTGISSGDVAFPSVAVPLRNQAGEIIAGFQLMKMGAPRMYEVGALQKQSPVDPSFQGMVGWLGDVGKGALLLIGLFATVAALTPKEKP